MCVAATSPSDISRCCPVDVTEELGPTEYLLKSHIACPPNDKVRQTVLRSAWRPGLMRGSAQVKIITPHETNSIRKGVTATLEECPHSATEGPGRGPGGQREALLWQATSPWRATLSFYVAISCH